jgi:hypothetical protein
MTSQFATRTFEPLNQGIKFFQPSQLSANFALTGKKLRLILTANTVLVSAKLQLPSRLLPANKILMRVFTLLTILLG